jgi:hypothetical protein
MALVFAALLLPILANLVELSDGTFADAPLQKRDRPCWWLYSRAFWTSCAAVGINHAGEYGQAWFFILTDHPDCSGLYAAQ